MSRHYKQQRKRATKARHCERFGTTPSECRRPRAPAKVTKAEVAKAVVKVAAQRPALRSLIALCAMAGLAGLDHG